MHAIKLELSANAMHKMTAPCTWAPGQLSLASLRGR